MRTNIFQKLWSGAVVLLLAACSSGSDISLPTEDGGVAAQIVAEIADASTRASGTLWQAGDKIGVLGPGGLETNNCYITKDGNGIFTAVTNPILMNDDKTYKFDAYYPYMEFDAELDKDLSYEDRGGFNINTIDQTKQEEFDIMLAQGATASRSNPQVSFTGEHQFIHKMSKLNLIFRGSEGVTLTPESFPSFYIHLLATGRFYPDRSEVQANYLLFYREYEIEQFGGKIWGITVKTKEAGFTKFNSYHDPSVIVIPQRTDKTQDYSPQGFYITVKYNNQDYKVDLTDTPKNGNESFTELKAGVEYTYTIIVKKTGLELAGTSIAAWEEGASGSGSATLP